MYNRFKPNTLTLACLVSGGIFIASSPAWADVVGRLSISVRDIDTEKPVPNAVVTLHDNAGVRGDITLDADADGDVTTPLLETRSWGITTSATGYGDDARAVAVIADTVTPIEVDLEVKQEKVIKISANKNAVDKTKTDSSSVRSYTFIAHTPAGNGNSQSLGNLLITNPGMVQSTNNQVHPRGEHASTTVVIDGAELPGASIGRGGQFISPETLQSADIITGAYAPEYGSEAAAILNLSLKSGTIKPSGLFSVTGGSFGTFDSDLSVGGQFGAAQEPGIENSPRRFSYFFDGNYRSTQDALEAPQPDPANAHNAGTSSTVLGHFDYTPDVDDKWSLVLNTTPANTEVANRTGLSPYYGPVGEGYGYGGARNITGYLPGWSATSGPLPSSDAGVIGTYGSYVPGSGSNGQFTSQEQDGQDDYQKDNNSFGVLNYRHVFNQTTTSLISISETNSVTQLLNNNPSINLNSVYQDPTDPTDPLNGTLSTVDNSIEFNPNLKRTYNQSQIQANLTKSANAHTFKGGIIYDDQSGDETYQFTPQSQLALDALSNIYSFAPNYQNIPNPLLPSGSFTGGVDALGNPIWVMAQPGETFPTLTVHKTGYYGAAYLQDTWNESRRFTVNYGARFDAFHQSNQVSNDQGYSSSGGLSTAELSPRLNTAYQYTRSGVFLLSYDKLFTQPPLAQGAIVGQVIKPETWNQYEAAVVKQISDQQGVKLDYYYKDIRNQDDTGILIPYTQIGALTTLNYQFASVHGVEFSYNQTPRSGVGTGAFVAYTYSVAKPGGLDETGGQAPTINDHNQYDTLTTGANYTWKSQAYVSSTVYFGSGEASSILGPVAAAVGPDGAPTLGGGNEQPRFQVDARVASSPGMLLGYVGLQLDVINVFDSLAVDNFNSGFSGTRFQQPRTFLVTAMAHF